MTFQLNGYCTFKTNLQRAEDLVLYGCDPFLPLLDTCRFKVPYFIVQRDYLKLIAVRIWISLEKAKRSWLDFSKIGEPFNGDNLPGRWLCYCCSSCVCASFWRWAFQTSHSRRWAPWRRLQTLRCPAADQPVPSRLHSPLAWLYPSSCPCFGGILQKKKRKHETN